MASIKTKFNIDDKVWVVYDGRKKYWTIRGINVKVRGDIVEVSYELKPLSSGYYFTYKESEIFKTEKALERVHKFAK